MGIQCKLIEPILDDLDNDTLLFVSELMNEEWWIDNETAVFVSNRNSKFKFGIMSQGASQKLTKLIRGIRKKPTIS